MVPVRDGVGGGEWRDPLGEPDEVGASDGAAVLVSVADGSFMADAVPEAVKVVDMAGDNVPLRLFDVAAGVAVAPDTDTLPVADGVGVVAANTA